MEPRVIRTAQLDLRPLRPADRQEFVRMHTISREHFAPWMPSGMLDRPLEDIFEENLQRAAAEAQSGAGVRLGGFLREREPREGASCSGPEAGRLAGLFTLSQIFRGPLCSCYAGWRISVDCIGQGLCTEAMRAVLDLAFGDPALSGDWQGLGLHRVQANVIPENFASVRVAEKLGLRREGVALRYLHIGGAWRDHIMFAITAEEWAPRPAGRAQG